MQRSFDELEAHVTEQLKRPKRTVTAPTNDPLRGGQVLSVELSPDEDVGWIWSHDRERGSRVTGYRIVIPAARGQERRRPGLGRRRGG